jgi:hypothetical protein
VIILNECELITFISAIACTISKCYTDDEISLLSSAFNQLGDSLATILAKRDLCSKNTNMENNNQ